ncbi:MAG: hypothetical protein OXB84_02040 [Halobacteriovoraceae bacterium]|nr:hypothetical protein [Halobacteriovoraceae bacterium]
MKFTLFNLLWSFLGNSFAYDALDRYILLEDKLKTQELSRPYGHNFVWDISLLANKNLLKFTKDIGEISDIEGTLTDKINESGAILQQYNNTEQTILFNMDFQFPVPRFRIRSFTFKPNIRLGTRFGSNFGIRAEPLNNDTVLQLVGNSIPQVLRSAIATTNFLPGEDIMERVCTDRGMPLSTCPDTGQYYYPTLANAPLTAVYTKLDAKLGLFTPYQGLYWFGDFNFYSMFRTDFRLLMSADQIARGQSPLEGQGKRRQQIFLMTDYRLGFRLWEKLETSFSVEEFKITRLSDNVEEAGELNQKITPLFRVHTNLNLKQGIFTFSPFVGAHKRKNYEYKNGFYGGLDTKGHFLNDNMEFLLRAMADREHLSLASRFTFTVFQLEYLLKKPITSAIENVNISTLHSVNIRFFF